MTRIPGWPDSALPQAGQNACMHSRRSFFPHREIWRESWLACCVLCEGTVISGKRACSGCLPEIERLGCLPPSCPVCAGPSPDPRHPCGHCQRRRPAFDRAFAAWRYTFPLDHLLHAAKFRRNFAALGLLGDLMAARMAECAKSGWNRPGWSKPEWSRPEWNRPAGLIALPLHPKRLRERGYNQSAWLAEACARSSGIPLITSGLVRQRDTQPQSGLHRDERRRNIRRAFLAEEGLPAHVAIIDDVMTTGTTLDDAARALRRAGVQRVDAWVALRAGQK